MLKSLFVALSVAGAHSGGRVIRENPPLPPPSAYEQRLAEEQACRAARMFYPGVRLDQCIGVNDGTR